MLGDAHPFDVLLIDCLTLWVNNLMYHATQQGPSISEADVAQRCGEMLDAAGEGAAGAVRVAAELHHERLPGR